MIIRFFAPSGIFDFSIPSIPAKWTTSLFTLLGEIEPRCAAACAPICPARYCGRPTPTCGKGISFNRSLRALRAIAATIGLFCFGELHALGEVAAGVVTAAAGWLRVAVAGLPPDPRGAGRP